MKKLLLSLSLAVAAMFTASADTFVKVTDASTLKAGDEIIIVDKNGTQALGTNQKSNNRESVAVTATDGVIVPGDNVQVITLEESGDATYPWLLKVGENGYLYAPSKAASGQNYLRTQETPGTTANFSISITSEGIATVKANNQYANTLQYNSKLFSCYTSGQTDIAIYAKAAEGVEKIDYTALPEELTLTEGESQALATFFPASIEFVSLDDEIATVDKGVVTAVAPGEVTIMASWEADDTFTAGEAEINVTVNAIALDEYTGFPEAIAMMQGTTKVIAANLPKDVLFESRNEDVVTISEDGVLTAVAPGETTIYAVWGNDKETKIKEGEVEIAVTVTEYVQTTDVTFDFVNNYAAYGLTPSSNSNAYSSAEEVEISTDNVTLNVNSKWVLWDNGKTFRCYAGAEMTFTAPAGYNIIKIEANFESGCDGYSAINYNGTPLSAAWTSEEGEGLVEFSFTKKTFFKTITVTLQEIGGAGDDPVVEPLDYDIVILDSKGETLSGVIGSHDLDSVESFTIYFSQNNAEGISFYYMLEANTEEPEVETLAAEPAEGYTLYNNEEGIVIPNNYNGTLSYYAQDDATEAKTDIKTISIDPNQNTSGISAVEIDAANGAVEYFNLQGVRVNAPATGLFLMRQGDKVMKVVIR